MLNISVGEQLKSEAFQFTVCLLILPLLILEDRSRHHHQLINQYYHAPATYQVGAGCGHK